MNISEHVKWVRVRVASESDYLTGHNHEYRTSHTMAPPRNAVLVLSAEHVDQVTASFNTLRLQSIVARAFLSLSHHDLVSPQRTAIDMPEHRALFMPARIPNIGTTIKVVSVPLLSGDTRGIPGSTLVLDEKTGSIKALVNARSLTTLRTAAGKSYHFSEILNSTPLKTPL